MKRTSLGWTVGAALFLGCATTASRPPQAPGAQAAEDPDAAEAAPERLVCEDVATTGSHLKKRICRPAKVVEAEREEAQRTLGNQPRVTPVDSN